MLPTSPDMLAAINRGPSGSHRIDGIGIGFVPPLWHADEVDEILPVSTGEATAMCRRLAREEGILAGTSTGANVVAALRVARRLAPGATVATIIVDSGLRYLCAGLYQGA
jgi:cysteine synthase